MKLEEIENLCNEATPGSWGYQDISEDLDEDFPHCIISGPQQLDTDGFYYSSNRYTEKDAKFITASRTLIPKLLAIAKIAKKMMKTQVLQIPVDHSLHKEMIEAFQKLEKD